MTTTDTTLVTAATDAPAFTDDPVSRGERAVLLCCDEPRYRDYLAGVLRGATTGGGLRVQHVGSHAAAIARLASGRPRYAAVVLIEHLEGCPGLAENRLLAHLAQLPGAERRELFVALVGQTVATGDADATFAAGVDAAVQYGDVGGFADLVLPALAEREQANHDWRDALATAKGGA